MKASEYNTLIFRNAIKTTACIILFFFTFIIHAKAQSTSLSAGGNIYGSGGSASISIGQVFFFSTSNSTVDISEGVQQPFEISVINSVENNHQIDLSYSIYPNPTTDYIFLKVDGTELKHLSYTLFDITGKLVANDVINNNETSITMAKLPSSVYILKVLMNSREVKSFKIIKN